MKNIFDIIKKLNYNVKNKIEEYISWFIGGQSPQREA